MVRGEPIARTAALAFMSAGAAVLLLVASTCSGGGPAQCEVNDECGAGELCVSGECMPADIACGADQPCPSGQHCCQGNCGEARCCVLHTDCVAGYCLDSRCQDGPRPTCPTEPCNTGVCNTDTGTCVECMRHSDCTQPTGCPKGDCIVCGVDKTCVEALQDCTQSICDQNLTNQICALEEGCRNCIENTSDCGDKVCVGGTCVPCTTTAGCYGGLECIDVAHSSAGIDRVCSIAVGTWCDTSADCGDLVCLITGAHEECLPCSSQMQCNDGRAGYTCEQGPNRCIPNDEQCIYDDDCNPPVQICQAGLCVLGCTRGNCTEGQACSERSGRCYMTGGGTTILGQSCTAHADCLSGACWRGNVDGTDTMICSQPCARYSDCPSEFLCWELGDANMCVPIWAVFDTPYPPFDQLPGWSCDGDYFQNHDCRTDYCRKVTEDAASATCMQTCGRNADCGNLPVDDLTCVSGWPIGDATNGSGATERSEAWGFTQLCHGGWGRIGPNLPCATGASGSVTAGDHDLCRSGWCAWTPDRTRAGHCAEACCSPSDCDPNHPICKPIDIWDGVREANEPGPYGFQKICLWREYTGGKEVGEPCGADSQCKSEICASASSSANGICTTTCCTNDDCAGYTFAPVCRRANKFGSGNGAILYDSAYDSIRYSLGRQVRIDSGSGQMIGMSTLCLPP